MNEKKQIYNWQTIKKLQKEKQINTNNEGAWWQKTGDYGEPCQHLLSGTMCNYDVIQL